MKIGILTYHRAHNYGAILQAIATRVILQRFGHEVNYIDYWPDYHKSAYVFFSWKRLWKYKWDYLKNRLLLHNEILNRIAHFERDIKEHIEPYCIPYKSKTNYDVAIYGSDQIWRKQIATKKLNPVYFGQNEIVARKHITYAASMGILDEDYSDIERIKSWIHRFSKLSVREKDLKQYLKNIGFDSELVLDPTLLLSAKDWDEIINPKPVCPSGYVLYYSLNPGAFDEKAIKNFASAKGLRVVEIKGVAGKDSENSISQCGPCEFISLIKHADYIFSTSYHGLIFSIIFHKEFYTSFTGNFGRAESILTLIEHKERLITPGISSIPTFKDIDYVQVDDILSKACEHSVEYLKML